MNNKIIDFFKFLEEKKGTKTPFELKLLHQDKFKLTKEDLSVDKDLFFRRIETLELPNGLYVNGNLNLFGSNILLLPNKLRVTGILNLRRTPIVELPDDIVVGKHILIDPEKIDDFGNWYPHLKFYY